MAFGSLDLEPQEIGLSLRFDVEFTTSMLKLGLFTKLDGLGLEITGDAWKEGGCNEFDVFIPRRVTHKPITLSRVVTMSTASLTMSFIRGFLSSSSNDRRENCTITCYTAWGAPAGVWELLNVYPTKWQGPSFDASSSKPAIETLTIQYEGFGPPLGPLTTESPAQKMAAMAGGVL